MESTELTVRLIILFVPGIIGTFIYGVCRHRQEMNNRDYFINVVLTAFVMYSFTYVGLKMLGEEATFLDALMDSSVQINKIEVLLASGLSVFAGFLEARIVRKVMLLNRKKSQEKTRVRASVWDDLFEEDGENGSHVKVVLKQRDTAYEGIVEKYSSSQSNRKELCLKDAVKYDLNTGKQLQRDIRKIYLQIRDDEDVIIEIL